MQSQLPRTVQTLVPSTQAPASTSDIVSNALSSLNNDPYDFNSSEASGVLSLAATPPTSRQLFSTQANRQLSFNPRRQPRVAVDELGVWKLLPCEVLNTDPYSVPDTARSKQPTDSAPAELSTGKIEELKAGCLNQRALFAKSVVNSTMPIEELYNRNVNGRNSTGNPKERINPVKMAYVKELTFKVFPCLPSEQKASWSDCVKVIDKSNLYLFNTVIEKKLDVSHILDYLRVIQFGSLNNPVGYSVC